MANDSPNDYQTRINDLEYALLRKDQFYFDKLNQYAKELEANLDKINQYMFDLDLAHQKSMGLESDIKQYKEEVAMHQEKVSELSRLLDVNYLAIQQSQEELELCHLEHIKIMDKYTNSLKKQLILFVSTLINRSRSALARIVPFRILYQSKRIIDKWIMPS